MVGYRGMHPLYPHQGAFCYVDAPHMHRVAPPDLRVYVVSKNGENVFVGDPVALGYDGPKFGYFGPHPMSLVTGTDDGTAAIPPDFCYIAGPHFHAAPPPPSSAMVQKAGVFWYIGPPPPADPGRTWINEVHAIASYVPPKVAISDAPPGYHPFTFAQLPPALPTVAAPPSAAKARAARPAKAAPAVGGRP